VVLLTALAALKTAPLCHEAQMPSLASMRRLLSVAMLLLLFAISALAEKQEPQVFHDKLEIYEAWSRKFQIELLVAPPQDFNPPFIDQTGRKILSPTAILMQVREYGYVEQSVECGHGRVFSATPTNSVSVNITETDLFELKKLIDNAVAKLQRISEESKPSR
jgi:hypothetical protein